MSRRTQAAVGIVCMAVLPLLWATAGQAQTTRPPPTENHAQHGMMMPESRSETGWTTLPLLVAAGRPGPGGVMVAARNIAADRLRIRGPEAPATVREAPLENGRAKAGPAAPTLTGYHWLSARAVKPGETSVASAIWSFGSKGDSPQALLDLPKETLEIVPELATTQYRENASSAFSVRFEGKPLPGVPVSLETANGTRQQLHTDMAGRVQVMFPRDFDEKKLAGAEDLRRIQAGFVLAVTHQTPNQRYLTAFNSNYNPDRMRERNLGWGAGFAGLGMLLALPLLLRKRGIKDA